MFSLQREGTVLKGRGRSQCAEHENEEAQVDQGLTACPAVMLSDPQSTRSAAQAGRWSPIQTFLPPFVKRQTIWTLTATAKSQSVIALEEVHQILMRRGSWRNWLVTEYISEVDLKVSSFLEKKAISVYIWWSWEGTCGKLDRFKYCANRSSDTSSPSVFWSTQVFMCFVDSCIAQTKSSSSISAW